MTKQILELLQHDPKGTYHYLEALGLQGEVEGQSVLVQYASSTNQFWRKAAVWSLREFKTEEARLALEKAIADPEWKVRMGAVESLGKLNDVHSLPVLLRALRDENHLVVYYAIRAVVSLGDESAVPGLLELLKSEDEEVRMRVCLFIGEMKLKNTRAVCDALLERLNDKSKQVRTSAIGSLAVFRERRAVPQLLAIAKDPSESSGGDWMQPPPGPIAFMALGAIGDPAALPFLIQKLDEPEWNKGACEALVAMGAQSAKPLLDHYLRATGKQSRSDELAALAKVGTRETLSELQQYLAKCPPLEKRAIRSTITEIEKRLSH